MKAAAWRVHGCLDRASRLWGHSGGRRAPGQRASTPAGSSTHGLRQRPQPSTIAATRSSARAERHPGAEREDQIVIANDSVYGRNSAVFHQRLGPGLGIRPPDPLRDRGAPRAPQLARVPPSAASSSRASGRAAGRAAAYPGDEGGHPRPRAVRYVYPAPEMVSVQFQVSRQG